MFRERHVFTEPSSARSFDLRTRLPRLHPRGGRTAPHGVRRRLLRKPVRHRRLSPAVVLRELDGTAGLAAYRQRSRHLGRLHGDPAGSAGRDGVAGEAGDRQPAGTLDPRDPDARPHGGVRHVRAAVRVHSSHGGGDFLAPGVPVRGRAEGGDGAGVPGIRRRRVAGVPAAARAAGAGTAERGTSPGTGADAGGHRRQSARAVLEGHRGPLHGLQCRLPVVHGSRDAGRGDRKDRPGVRHVPGRLHGLSGGRSPRDAGGRQDAGYRGAS